MTPKVIPSTSSMRNSCCYTSILLSYVLLILLFHDSLTKVRYTAPMMRFSLDGRGAGYKTYCTVVHCAEEISRCASTTHRSDRTWDVLRGWSVGVVTVCVAQMVGIRVAYLQKGFHWNGIWSMSHEWQKSLVTLDGSELLVNESDQIRHSMLD